MAATDANSVSNAPPSLSASALPSVSRLCSGCRTRSRTTMVSSPSWLKIAKIPTRLCVKLKRPSRDGPRVRIIHTLSTVPTASRNRRSATSHPTLRWTAAASAPVTVNTELSERSREAIAMRRGGAAAVRDP